MNARGLSLIGVMTSVGCDSTASQSRLRLSGSTLAGGADSAILVGVGNCNAIVETTEFQATSLFSSAVVVLSSGFFYGDRLHVRGNPSQATGIASIFSTRATIQITNSLLENVLIDLYSQDTQSPGSSLALGNNTIVGGAGFFCRDDSASAFRSVVLDNNIVFNPGAFDTVDAAPQCTFRHNVVYPQSTALPGNMVADPAFVNVAGADYHLTAASPAVDAAEPTTLFASFTADLDGVTRPQGAAADVGAFELKLQR